VAVGTRTILVTLLAVAACDVPDTRAVLYDQFVASTKNVVFAAQWENIAFTTSLAPGEASPPEPAFESSGTPAYVVVAPDFDLSSPEPPATLLLLESKQLIGVALGTGVTIAVDDTTFTGDCDADSMLPQADADLMTERVFPGLFVGRRYDAATCMTEAP
jgi:hypothetical protein